MNDIFNEISRGLEYKDYEIEVGPSDYMEHFPPPDPRYEEYLEFPL